WVLTLQAGPMALARLLAAALVLALAAWLFGRAQARGGWKLQAPAAALALAALVASVWPAYDIAPPADGASPQGAALAYEAYSPERLAALRAEGKPVFVNFTAAWCVSCQVNEKVALSTGGVADAFARTGTAYLKADWTRKDAEIAAALESYGRAGVPLYVVYGAKGGDGVILPQILTEGAVVRALEAAAKS
ncbi:MAG: thioredoxin family protein, partial [Caulobacteraceae bacterium]|nr:thioredoxin family protein [Caulobacteraceae bacterium]